ncbi:stress response translation initiation inhibitor YciH [Psittacicella melopsittaci]|uniref:Stress response translation initiation inhibitor YciH n=1 Tax=Psittacicella melopsittaci TaxID=2028576 RepID=A0A3A1Y3J2_9GAMM|nr:stress response translation initiation inhibitor YciH [Psittacicella melopsittaci]RIY32803.1 stress response translation initiation inhibitor YciH [Psittacicella melopsittaci]
MSLVYSTDGGRVKPQVEQELPPEGDGVVRLYKQTKGRKGAGVVLVSGTGLDKAGLKDLCSFLKKKLGVGGSVEEWDVVIQGGDKRPQIQQLLEQKGFKVKISGG